MTDLKTKDGAPFDPALYEIRLRPLTKEEGGGWFAEMPGLPGCMGDGETEQAAIEDVRAAALEWALSATEINQPIPSPRISLQAAE